MRCHEVGGLYRKGGSTPYLEVWEQPFLRWAIAEVYHWWDMHSIPFMKHVSKWHNKLFGGSIDYIPLLARQDLRCYYLSQMGRKNEVIIEITEKQYEEITGKPRE